MSRVAAQRRPRLGAEEEGRHREAARRRSPRTSATTTSSASTRASAICRRATSLPRREGSVRRRPRRRPRRPRRLSRLPRRHQAPRRATRSRERYGNLFEMYEQITGENPYKRADAHLPGRPLHDGRAVGRLQPETTIPGLFVLGEANFSDHGANRLGASALMQGLADGYFVIPYTIGNYLAGVQRAASLADTTSAAFTVDRGRGQARSSTSCSTIGGKRSRRLVPQRARPHPVGRLRHGAQQASRSSTRSRKIPKLREEFWRMSACSAAATRSTSRSRRPAASPTSSSSASCMCRDALEREESCGGHFRDEHQTADGEAKRDDEHFCHVAVWEFTGDDDAPMRNIEPLVFENVQARDHGATSERRDSNLVAPRLAPDRIAKSTGAVRDATRSRTCRRTCRSSRCSTSSTRSWSTKGEEPIAFDHDCREGICGMCSLMINGRPHGGRKGTTTCQLHMRFFKDGDEISIEPWRAAAFPVMQGSVRRSQRVRSRDRRRAASSRRTPARRPTPTPCPIAEGIRRRARWTPRRASAAAPAWPRARTARRCCSRPRSSRTSHLLPQGQPERARRTRAMVAAMDAEGFGNCSNHYECEAACPKDISRDVMAELNRDYAKATFVHRDRATSPTARLTCVLPL